MKNDMMPTIFLGHGSPMMALEDSNVTRKFKELGDKIVSQFGKPKAIIAISAHWFTKGSYVNSEKNPKQIYDMYGFPDELYQVKYPVEGLPELAKRLADNEKLNLNINNEWGIDHGIWTVMVHMFPKADIPIVELSVDDNISTEEMYKFGQEISKLRREGYLIVGSGNIVHNLRQVQWNNGKGTKESEEFDKYIKDSIINNKYENVINYKENPSSMYAVPTPDHYLPLICVLGASVGQKPRVFNEEISLGSISMTSYAFGIEV